VARRVAPIDLVGVAPGGALDGDRGSIDGRDMSTDQVLADQGHRHTGARPNLQDLVLGSRIQQPHCPP